MARSRWTLMLVPHDNEQVLSFQISSRGVRAGLSAVLLVLVSLGVLGIGFFVKRGHEVHADRLARENELLAAEVETMRGRMDELNASIEDLAAKDEKYRVISGIPELDPELEQAAGVEPARAHLASTALLHLNPDVGTRVVETASDLNALLHRADQLRSSMDEALHALERNRDRLASVPSIAPSSGHLSSLFSPNRRHPVLRITRPHKGIDIAAPVGEPILAPAKGTVRFSGNRRNGYGNMVEIDHGYGYVTRFAHASRLNVRTGQRVERGDVIAEVGATGLVSGPHLHYEVEVNGSPVDPLNFIIDDAIP